MIWSHHYTSSRTGILLNCMDARRNRNAMLIAQIFVTPLREATFPALIWLTSSAQKAIWLYGCHRCRSTRGGTQASAPGKSLKLCFILVKKRLSYFPAGPARETAAEETMSQNAHRGSGDRCFYVGQASFPLVSLD